MACRLSMSGRLLLSFYFFLGRAPWLKLIYLSGTSGKRCVTSGLKPTGLERKTLLASKANCNFEGVRVIKDGTQEAPSRVRTYWIFISPYFIHVL